MIVYLRDFSYCYKYLEKYKDIYKVLITQKKNLPMKI